MLIIEQITPAELPQLCFNFLFLVIRPLVSATTLLQIVVLLFQSRVAPRILTPNISLILTFGDSGLVYWIRTTNSNFAYRFRNPLWSIFGLILNYN